MKARVRKKVRKKERKEKERKTYNCQILDFFFSVRVGFSLEALYEKS